ncbi:hypothetical protein B0H14DRAFT_2600516 [Mycena olivaceomarginata]|nr:hypothetical protein B0H14DRAFT_2600516 [Mycena olivaceomarginata]
MCNAISTSILFGMLSHLPGNRYIALGIVSGALIIYAANRQHPSCKLRRVEHKIQACEETLKKVKEVHRSTLLAIEAERQRQLSEGIKEICEIHETVICSPAAARPTTRPATRRLELGATRDTSYDISM